MSKMVIFSTQGYFVVIGVLTAYWFTQLPKWTTWVLLVAMSLYDLAVVLLLGGPLRLLVELAISRDEDIPTLVYEASPQKRKKGVKPTLFELQKEMHMRKDGTYSYEHSKNICIEYERLINKASIEKGGDLTTEEKDDIYLKLVGGVKKQRVFGIGSMSSSYASDSRSTASFMEGTGVQQSAYETEMMNVKNELQEEKTQRKALEEKMEKMKKEFQQELNHVLERVDGSTRDCPL